MASTSSVIKANRLLRWDTQSYSPITGLSFSSSTTTRDVPQIIRSTSKTWSRTPGYRAIVAAGGVLPENSFSYDTFMIPNNGGSMILPMTVNGASWSRSSLFYTGPIAVGVDVPDGFADNNKLNSKLIDAAKGNQWNVPVFFVEGRKTVEMVVDAATRIALMGRALRRGRINDFLKYSHPSNKTRVASNALRQRFGRHYAKDPQGAFASYWLQMTYGWVPFMGDVKNAMNSLMDTAERPESLDGTVRARYSQTSTPTLVKNAKVFSDAGLEIWGDYEYLKRESFRATWHYTVKPGDVPGRFGLLNPLEVVWELIPLSFVADWFLPIGDYLSAMDAPFRFSHRGGTYGYRAQTEMSTLAKRMVPSTGTFTGFSGTGSYTMVRRTVMSSIPSVKLLNFSPDTNMSASRVTSAIALLHQLFSKK